MKVKLDENLGALAVRLFDAAGHDVATVRMQRMNGAHDRRIYDVCRTEARLLVTLDLDFANPFRFDPAPTAGIAVIRVPTMPGLRDLEEGVRLLVAELEKLSVRGRLWIVGRGRAREYLPEAVDLAGSCRFGSGVGRSAPTGCARTSRSLSESADQGRRHRGQWHRLAGRPLAAGSADVAAAGRRGGTAGCQWTPGAGSRPSWAIIPTSSRTAQ